MFMYSDDKLLGELYEPTKQTALIINNLRIKQQWLKMTIGFKERRWKC